MRVVILVSMLANLLGCGGGTPPTVSNISVSTSPVVRGQPASGQVHVADSDGLGGLKLRLRIAGAAASTTDEISVEGASNYIKAADVPFVFRISTTAPTGEYTLGVTAIDGSGNGSREVTTSMSVQ